MHEAHRSRRVLRLLPSAKTRQAKQDRMKKLETINSGGPILDDCKNDSITLRAISRNVCPVIRAIFTDL